MEQLANISANVFVWGAHPDGSVNLDIFAARPAIDGKKEYIITARPEAIDAVEQDLENDTSANNQVDSAVIPDRAVAVANRRPGSDNQTHYWLTDEEAANIRNDPRILLVEPTIEFTENKAILPCAIDYSPFYNFNRPNAAFLVDAPGSTRNYALHICGNGRADYSTGSTSPTDDQTYRYILDGNGVDVIIQDDGVQVDHPEWLDPSGTYSRFQQVNWFTLTGVAGTMPAQFYTLAGSGHGTHVASTVAGRTFGWAKMANIYSMKVMGTGAISAEVSFDLIKNFHKNKPIDPKTGRKRPTIVNASWTSLSAFLLADDSGYVYGVNSFYPNYSVIKVGYRGTETAKYDYDPSVNGLTGQRVGTVDLTGSGASMTGGIYYVNSQTGSLNTALESCLNEGVVYVRAAGNFGHKVEESGNVDYDNYFKVPYTVFGIIFESGPQYYHRNGSPYAANAISVGSTWYQSYNGIQEARAYYSSFGTGVHVFAPGTGITAAWRKQNDGYYTAFYKDPKTGDVSSHYVACISGTSMASPQVTGFLALYLQSNPQATSYDCKRWLQTFGSNTTLLYSTGLDNDYTSTETLGGGPALYLTSPWRGQDSVQVMEGEITLENSGLNII